jgi:hypothetical protein
MFWERVRKGGLATLNSAATAGRMSDVTTGQRLSEAQPKPMTMKSYRMLDNARTS